MNNRGFSLIELMIALGVLTAVLLGYMKMMAHQTKQSRTNTAAQEMANYYNEISAYIGKSDICEKTFKDKTFTENLKIDSILKRNGTAKYLVGKPYAGNVIKIQSMALNEVEREVGNPYKASAQLAIHFEKLGRVYGAKVIRKTIELDFILNKDSKVVTCASLGSTSLQNLNLGSLFGNLKPKVKPKEDTDKSPQLNVAKGDSDQKKPETIVKYKTNPEDKKKIEMLEADKQKLLKTIEGLTSDSQALSVSKEEAEKIQAIIDSNPQLKQMQDMLKNLQDRHQEALDEVDY